MLIGRLLIDLADQVFLFVLGTKAPVKAGVSISRSWFFFGESKCIVESVLLLLDRCLLRTRRGSPGAPSILFLFGLGLRLLLDLLYYSCFLFLILLANATESPGIVSRFGLGNIICSVKIKIVVRGRSKICTKVKARSRLLLRL